MLNKIALMGRLVRDPELKHTQSGVAVGSFTIAVDRDFKTKSGEKETDFVDIVVWRNTAEFVAKYFAKGRMAVVEGRLQIRSYTDKENNKRRAAEVVAENVYFGDSKRDGDNGNSYGGSYGGGYGGGYGGSYGGAYGAPDNGSGSTPDMVPSGSGYNNAPGGVDENGFAKLEGDDEELPF